jgi:hypothetical protein
MGGRVVRIEVTQEHIDNGKPKLCMSCPVALALKAATGDWYAWAGPTSVGFNKEVHRVPTSVQEFMMRYDEGELVQPFAFELGDTLLLKATT